MRGLSVRAATMGEAARCVNTERPLTRSSGTSREGLAMKATRTSTGCAVAGCARPPRSAVAEHCEMHYYRLRRTGTTGGPEPIVVPYPRCSIDECTRRATDDGMCWTHGRQFTPRPPPPPCTFDGCDAPVDSRDLCKKHYTRWLRHGDPGVRLPTGRKAGSKPVYSLTYVAIHQRLRHWRGRATGHSCVGCGEGAAQWAMTTGFDKGLRDPGLGPFSDDVADYAPMCVPCHKRMDLARIGAAYSNDPTGATE